MGAMSTAGWTAMRMPASIAVAQALAHRHERHDTLVADDDRVRDGIPAVHERMRRTLVEQLVDRRADARRIDARQQLPGSGSRHRHAAHGQVTGARAVQHRGPHLGGDGPAGLTGQDGARAPRSARIGGATRPAMRQGRLTVRGAGEGPDGRRGQGADGRPEPGRVLRPEPVDEADEHAARERVAGAGRVDGVHAEGRDVAHEVVVVHPGASRTVGHDGEAHAELAQGGRGSRRIARPP